LTVGSFDTFFSSIVGQESGGNYGAVNARTGALGFAQVMPANVAAWSKEILGYAVTPQQFLNSPQLQNAIVRGKLQKYYNAYGARGAAAAWYSGDYRQADNYRKFNANEPSIGEYVDQVLGRAGGGNSYGYTSAIPVDNTVKQTDLSHVYGQDLAEPIDALKGTDVKGLGLKQIDTTSLGADTGGAGSAAPAMSSPVGDQQAKPTAADAAMQRSGLLTQAKANGDLGRRQGVIDIAKQYVGTPYVWGGAAPGGFDCSGIIQYAMKLAGINIGRTSWQQLATGSRAGFDQLRPGDLVGFGSGGHIAIWLGGNQILEAPHTGANVRIRTLGKNESAFGVSLANLYG
jgi:cell wall-associated NlpC family hydrolase